MRKKGISPMAIVLLAVVLVVALLVATLVKIEVADSNWSGLIFWLVFMGISGPGCFLIGRFANKGGR